MLWLQAQRAQQVQALAQQQRARQLDAVPAALPMEAPPSACGRQQRCRSSACGGKHVGCILHTGLDKLMCGRASSHFHPRLSSHNSSPAVQVTGRLPVALLHPAPLAWQSAQRRAATARRRQALPSRGAAYEKKGLKRTAACVRHGGQSALPVRSERQKHAHHRFCKGTTMPVKLHSFSGWRAAPATEPE